WLPPYTGPPRIPIRRRKRSSGSFFPPFAVIGLAWARLRGDRETARVDVSDARAVRMVRPDDLATTVDAGHRTGSLADCKAALGAGAVGVLRDIDEQLECPGVAIARQRLHDVKREPAAVLAAAEARGSFRRGRPRGTDRAAGRRERFGSRELDVDGDGRLCRWCRDDRRSCDQPTNDPDDSPDPCRSHDFPPRAGSELGYLLRRGRSVFRSYFLTEPSSSRHGTCPRMWTSPRRVATETHLGAPNTCSSSTPSTSSSSSRSWWSRAG